MIKKLFLFLLIPLALHASVFSEEQMRDALKYGARAAPGPVTTFISVQREGGGHFSSNGVLISDRHILTTKHGLDSTVTSITTSTCPYIGALYQARKGKASAVAALEAWRSTTGCTASPTDDRYMIHTQGVVDLPGVHRHPTADLAILTLEHAVEAVSSIAKPEIVPVEMGSKGVRGFLYSYETPRLLGTDKVSTYGGPVRHMAAQSYKDLETIDGSLYLRMPLEGFNPGTHTYEKQEGAHKLEALTETGDSGAPVFNKKGNLIGIHKGKALGLMEEEDRVAEGAGGGGAADGSGTADDSATKLFAIATYLEPHKDWIQSIVGDGTVKKKKGKKGKRRK